MSKNILIFVPNSLDTHKTGYLKGTHKEFEDCEAFYVTDEALFTKITDGIGYVGKSLKNFKFESETFLFINSCSKKILVNNSVRGNQPVVEVVYDYNSFKNSDVTFGESRCYGKHFEVLTHELRKSTLGVSDNGKKSLLKLVLLFFIFLVDLLLKLLKGLKSVLFCSTTFIHFEESVVNLRWFLNAIVEERKVTPKIGNAFVAKLVDLLIGIVLLHWFLKYEYEILTIIQTAIDDLITNLKGLLVYLMGSPIGLKLNHAFNKTLGKFFFYHISLWRVFLQGMQPVLTSCFRFLVFPGALGFSFQVAMLADVIAIGTFHVYCIYVYAARLFFLQIRGLVSLWRLFIGRKFNPLRQRVDSCQYSQNQLFIGTLGFTILLFLLPTTTLYYTVFTTFRLVILLVDGVLLRVRYLLSTLPLYVVALWVLNSSSVAGTVYINWKRNEASDRVTIEAKLNPLPLTSSVKKFVPDTVQPITNDSFSYVFHCMLTGILV